MKKILGTSFVVLLTIIISACSNYTHGSGSSNTDLNQAYNLTLDEIISTDKNLNENMEYISIYFKNKPEKELDRKIITDHLRNKYKVEIYELSYDELKRNSEYVENENRLKGILVQIENQEILDDKVTLDISKRRGNIGAIAAKITLVFNEGEWKITKNTPTLES